MFAGITVDFLQRWAINVARLFEAVIILERVVPMSMYFANIADDKQIAVTALFAGEILVGDFILVYNLSSPILFPTHQLLDLSFAPHLSPKLLCLHTPRSFMALCRQ